MNHSKKYTGIYVAEVMDVCDPEKRCRIKVNVYDIFDGVPNADLPWANFVLPLGSRKNEGTINPVQAGDKVWVQFIAGDSRRPVITGSAQASPGGKVNLAPEACQGEGQFQHKRTDKQPKPEAPPYYEDVVLCQNRTLIQLCRSGNIRITQMDSGSALEILPSGHMVIHCEGNMYTSVKGNSLEEYDGNLEQVIKGNFTQSVDGSMNLTSKGAASIGSSQSSLNMSAASNGTMSGPGGLSFSGPASFNKTLTTGGDINSGGAVIDAGGNTNHHSH